MNITILPTLTPGELNHLLNTTNGKVKLNKHGRLILESDDHMTATFAAVGRGELSPTPPDDAA